MYTYIVRHGETDFSENDIIQGHLQNPLNETGVNTIQKVASNFVVNNIEISSIYASDLRRCVESAQIIAKAIGFTKEIQYAPALREIDLGIFEGRHKDELEYARIHSDNYYAFIPQDGESLDMLYARINDWLDLHSDQLQQALIVSHRGPISAIYRLAENKDEWDEDVLLAHGKIIVFDFSFSKKKIVDILG